MRVHASSRTIEPAALIPGSDLVLDVAPEHGADLPPGTAVDDYLDLELRRAVDRDAVTGARRWIEAMEGVLTVDDLCLPFIWEVEVYKAITRAGLAATGLRAAMSAHESGSIELIGRNAVASRIATAVAAATSSELRNQPGRLRHPRGDSSRRPTKRARRMIMATARRFGVPSHLRSGSVVLISYWPLEPVLDRMVEDRRLNPAVAVDKLPSGPTRTLRAAARGGWVGTPGPSDRRAVASRSNRALEAACAPPAIDAQGLEIGPAAHELIMALGRARALDDLARARMLRRVFARRPPAAILSAWDSEPTARLMIKIAKERGIPTFVLSHGSYLLTTAARDMNFGDEILTWSSAMEYPKPPAGTPVHVVGYPAYEGGAIPAALRTAPDPSAARILVLGQHTASIGLIDSRVEMQHYLDALAAVAEVAPAATIVLRPHPASGRAPAEVAAGRRPELTIEIDSETPIERLLAGSDLCVGAASAATLQAALFGTPVVALNLTRFEWEWPLGHDTSVPIARSDTELASWLSRWLAGEELPGRDAMLDGLGANGSDAVARIIEVVATRSAGRLS